MEALIAKAKLHKNIILAGAGVIGFLIIVIITVVLLSLASRSSNNSTTDTSLNNQNINQTNGPIETGSTYPAGICPDNIIYGSGLPVGIWDGKEYSVRPEDIPWLDSECKQNNQDAASVVMGAPIYNQKCTPIERSEFINAFTDYSDIKHIIPPGAAVGDTIKAHSYIALQTEKINIYAPADMYLVQGSYYKEPPSFVAKTTYILHFLVGCDMVINFDHITNPVDKIRQVLNQKPNEGTAMEGFLSEPVFFKAGELIGYTIGAGSPELIKTFDFGLYDKNHTNQFVNQARYEQNFDWKNLNAVCAFDYFSSELKDQYYNKLSSLNGNFVKVCRSPSQDKKGTLAGAWHKNPEDSTVAHRVGIAADLDGKSLSITGINNEFFSINDSEPTFIDPANVTSQHCYYNSSTNKFVFFNVASDTQMQAYLGTGRCPSNFSASLAQTYYR